MKRREKKDRCGFTNHSLPLLIFRGEVMVNSLGTLLNIGQLANRREAQHDQCSRAAVSTVSSSGRSCTHAQPSWSRLWSQLTTTVCAECRTASTVGSPLSYHRLSYHVSLFRHHQRKLRERPRTRRLQSHPSACVRSFPLLLRSKDQQSSQLRPTDAPAHGCTSASARQ